MQLIHLLITTFCPCGANSKDFDMEALNQIEQYSASNISELLVDHENNDSHQFHCHQICMVLLNHLVFEAKNSQVHIISNAIHFSMSSFYSAPAEVKLKHDPKSHHKHFF